MPAISRAFALGLSAAILVSTLGPSSAPSLTALAAPIPVPAPPTIRLADYAARPPVFKNATMVPPLGDVAAAQHENGMAVVQHTTSDPPALQRRQLDILTTLSSHLNIISDLAARSDSERSDPDFCSQAISAVTAYQTDLLNFQNFLGESDKGLGFYDPSNQLEESIKELVNSVKDSLKWIDQLVYNIPGLGPTLGPIVYQIKCILIGVLDFLEDFLDSLLNELAPTLNALIGQATTTACTNGWSCDGLL